MSTTFQLDTATSRANPTPAPMKRLTVPAIQRRKFEGKTEEPLVMLTAYTARQAQLLDQHCDMLLVGDSLGQVIYGLPSTLQVTLDMMIAHGAAVVRGSYHSVVIVDMPFGSYEASPQQAFESASRIMSETGCAAVKLEGGQAVAETIAFLSQRGIPVMAHVGLTRRPLTRWAVTVRADAARKSMPRSSPMDRPSPMPAPLQSLSKASSSQSPSLSRRAWKSPLSASVRPPSATGKCWLPTTCSACSSVCRAS